MRKRVQLALRSGQSVIIDSAHDETQNDKIDQNMLINAFASSRFV